MLSGRLVIADGSTGEAAAKNKELIDNFIVASSAKPDGNSLTHLHEPSLSLFERTSLALSKVGTPYVFVLGDDDLLFVDSHLTGLVKFLDANPDYSFCHGQSLWGWSNSATGIIARCCITKGRERYAGMFDNPVLNFCGIFYGFKCHSAAIRGPDLYYGLRRTAQYRETVEFICENPHLAEIPEIVIFGWTCLQGKMKCLEGHVLYRDVSAPSSAPLRNPVVIDDETPTMRPDLVSEYKEALIHALMDSRHENKPAFSSIAGRLKPEEIPFVAGMLAPSITHGETNQLLNEAEGERFDDALLRPNGGWTLSPIDTRIAVQLEEAEAAGKEVAGIETYEPVLWY
jgi:hypothetical protein